MSCCIRIFASASLACLVTAGILIPGAAFGESVYPQPKKHHAGLKSQLDRTETQISGICPPEWRPSTRPLNPALGCLPASVYFLPQPDGAPDVPDGKCPEGWRPVTSPLNPMLICLPERLAAEPSRLRLGRVDPFCPDGWKAVTPPVNRALICLPDRIIARLPERTGPGLPPGQCPEGWWRVTSPVNPVLGCLAGRSGLAPPGRCPGLRSSVSYAYFLL